MRTAGREVIAVTAAGVPLERRYVLAVGVVQAGTGGIGEHLDRAFAQRGGRPGRIAGPAHELYGFQAEQAVMPSGRVIGQHLRGDPQDGHVEQVRDRRRQLLVSPGD